MVLHLIEPGVIDVCRKALKTFESLGCIIEEDQPDYPLDAVWQAVLRLRGWQQGNALLPFYNDPAKRALLKPEAIFEVEMGLRQSAFDISAASVVRTEWYQAVRRLFERYDYFIIPTAQLFPFDIDMDWPHEIAGREMATLSRMDEGDAIGNHVRLPCTCGAGGFQRERAPDRHTDRRPQSQRTRMSAIGVCV